MLKAPHEGSTIGISKVESVDSMQAGFRRLRALRRHGAGRGIHPRPRADRAGAGREDVMRARCRWWKSARRRATTTTSNKYFSDDTEYLCPAPLDRSADGAHPGAGSAGAINALGCAGWARVDFMLRAPDDEPFPAGDQCTSPGMTGHSLVPMSAKRQRREL
jgi:D-alanine-D-alanine ligase